VQIEGDKTAACLTLMEEAEEDYLALSPKLDRQSTTWALLFLLALEQPYRGLALAQTHRGLCLEQPYRGLALEQTYRGLCLGQPYRDLARRAYRLQQSCTPEDIAFEHF
jgi:hypothetical protein